MEDISFNESKLFLQQAGPNGVSLFDHLASLVEQIQSVPEEQQFALIEEISKELKLSHYTQKPSEETALDEKVYAIFLVIKFLNFLFVLYLCFVLACSKCS